MRLSIIFLIVSCLTLAMFTGCSDSGDTLSTPSEGTDEHTSALAPMHFRMNFNPEDWSVSIEQIRDNRSADYDVTNWAEIQIYDTEWVPSERNWYISAQLKNTTSLTGYGVWVVFNELGEKEVRDVDGFIYYGPEDKRVPFIALNKDTPQREFPGLSVDSHTFVIHWPMDVNSWNPIDFYIDASWPGPRKKPMVEDLEQGNFPPPCYHHAIRANVRDFQSPSSELTVWADLSSYGDESYVEMFDDGEHEDGDENDGIFGTGFDPGSIFGTYTFTVYAEDPQGHMMENDLFFAPMSFPPLPPIEWADIAQGTQSGYHDELFEVIKDDDTWTTFWDEHGSNMIPPPAKPVIDFGSKMVAIVMLGEKPNSCYDVLITNVTYSDENCGIMIYYDEYVPTPEAVCFDVINYPFHFIELNKTGLPVGFKGTIVYVDGEDCLSWNEFDKGAFSDVTTPKEYLITSEPELISAYEELFGPGPGIPNINFDEEVVIILTQGTCNSSGYYIKVDDICINDDEEYEVEYHRMIPGLNCNVLWVITYPYYILTCEKSETPIAFNGDDVVYPC
jgi:hypothetical protein